MIKRINYTLILFYCFALALGGCASLGQQHFNHWPEGTAPEEVGSLLAEHFVETPHTNFGFDSPPSSITYSEVCTWYGALKFARYSDDQHLLEALEERYRPLMGEQQRLVPHPDHVDHTVFGAIPLELFLQTGKEKYLEQGIGFADQQWRLPERANGEQRKLAAEGLSWQTRYWIDDMFMISTIQAQAYRATGKERYMDRAAREMVVYLKELQRPNGLFYHAPDVPYFWGRGNGWMAAGMTELLRALPEDHPDRRTILQGYRTMMKSLLAHQAEDGMWRQLIDENSAWKETSSTGMFAFAMITGVKRGWLEEDVYGPAARKAWISLVSYIDENGDVRQVCQGTNKKNDKQYYLDRKRITGDMHGQAPVLWCAYALLEK
ncbi:glycosyl hydrolase [Echinicola soli]|uniref:Glycosyl hydrolase n=1 Tax=Echinicola soli TaxID=2591634 RepID=A0A514CND7_9BACT|nr:glycoside hydrolase family 88 protein [Echinicola soli]QDH81224.1 glycosyl hydrolase [Echinicola soli]